jgi:hypothetical protein
MSPEDSDIDLDEPTEDEELAEDEELEDLEPTADDIAESTVTPEPGLENVESIQDILAKQETEEQATAAAEEEDDAAALATMTKDERLEPTESRIVPMQETEFMCKNCFLVKHRSQLADKKRMFCRDCA